MKLILEKLKTTALGNLLWHVWNYSPSKRKLVLILTLSFIGAVLFNLEPLVVGKVFDLAQTELDNPLLMQYIFWGLFSLLLIEIISWIFHGTSRVMEQKNAFLVKRYYLGYMFKKTLDLPIGWHKKHHSGDTIDKINKAAENLGHFSRELFTLVQNVVRVVVSLSVLIFYDWRLIIFVIPGGIIAGLIIYNFDRILIKLYQKIFKAENFLASGVYDYISNIVTVLTLRLKPKAMKIIETRAMKAYKDLSRSAKLNEIKWFLVSVMIVAMTSSVLIMNAYTSYKSKGIIIIGTLFILYRYLSNIGSTLYNFAWQYSEMVRMNESLKAAAVLLEDYQKLVVENKGKLEPSRELKSDWRVVKLTGLSFAYEEETRMKNNLSNLSGVNFCFERGNRIALIGESGSGKSTMLSLLRGLYQPDSGKCYIDGKKDKLDVLRKRTLLIPQDPELFNDTVNENLTMGRKKSTSQEIKKALQLARFEKVVERLPKGLKTNVLERGVSLSGGEKQRLALARGILAAEHFDLILLDEPTSSVDSENELAIYQGIFREFPEKTIISAVHRLHLLKEFDYIYFFHQGKIIAEGTFMTMLQNEEFQKLWRSYGGQGEVR
ncbi:MAG TPA: ABC transporter ATP-binding protein [Candidatus Moranbacteria bacterium]|nr:ABC transporter ATP-binding protein [Candidatus Moranbacteria bacterium]